VHAVSFQQNIESQCAYNYNPVEESSTPRRRRLACSP
jgi:hypothetical protein